MTGSPAAAANRIAYTRPSRVVLLGRAAEALLHAPPGSVASTPLSEPRSVSSQRESVPALRVYRCAREPYDTVRR